MTTTLHTEKWASVPIGAGQETELYDLTDDPYGESNIAANHQDVVKDLHDRFMDWLDAMDAPEEAKTVYTGI